MKKKLTVSIGIPAYNEALNIRKLLNALLAQKQKSFTLREIIVVIDGATDNTEKIARSIRNPLVKCFGYKRRAGQQIRQNDILKRFTGDILVIIEADTLPYSSYTLEELVLPFCRSKSVGMVVGQIVPLSPLNFYEKILYHGTIIKWKIFNAWKSGNNLYMSGGHAMKAIPRKYAKKLSWPSDVPEDSYIYLIMRQMGVSIVKNSKAKIYMQNVHTFQDRIRQCKKFQGGKKSLVQYFSKSLIKSEYNIPKYLIAKIVLEEWLVNPFWTTLVLVEGILNRGFSIWKNSFSATYKTYDSSKSLSSAILSVKKKPTLLIGIPAFNEEQNIGILVRSVLKQKITHGTLSHILIISDGSTDKTIEVLSEIKNNKLVIIDRKKRYGINHTENEIINRTTADILVLLDADILPSSNRFIDNLIFPLLKDCSVGLSGAKIANVTPHALIEKILACGQDFKEILFENINSGNNIYTCHGRARAFAKEFYTDLKWPNDVPEDAYSYLACINSGFRFAYAENATALFRLPSTVIDHVKQSKRFESGKYLMYKYFPKESVANAYQIPSSVLIPAFAKSFFRNPLLFIAYVLLRIYIFYINGEKIDHKAVYPISVTTKNLLTGNTYAN